MKKLLVAILVGFIGTSAFAAWTEGTIKQIEQYPGSTKVVLDRTSDHQTFSQPIVGNAEVQKQILAIALTAKSSGTSVGVVFCNGGLCAIKMNTQ